MKKVELLAPAGGPEQFIAAVNAGADAVYLGGSLFNARIGAGNFTLDEMKEAVNFGHLRGVKTFVTLNTLMDDKDLPQALKYASKLYEMGVDALIIQDFGLGKVIRDSLPDFELHLSTQATVYNAEGVKAAQKLGYKRTVLSRECTLSDIRECAAVGEVEVFVHGALCICYSGQCQLSRFIGGRSGNKGMCAQPCRLPYLYHFAAGGTSDNPSPLSPKDLCMIDRLGDLIEAGAMSFKIEGRMKSPEYVATVVSIYRKYIDEYYARGTYTVSDADRETLLQAFNRDGFSEGYLEGDPGEALMTSGISKNTGVCVGRVIRNSGKGIFAEVSPSREIRMHDVLEIRGGSESTSFKVTSIKKTPSGSVILGDLKDSVVKGDKVYRLISEELLENSKAIASTARKVPVDMFVLAKVGEPLKLTSKDPLSGISFTLQDPGMPVQPAVKAGLTEKDIMKQLRKTGDTAYVLGDVRIVMDDNVFLPVSMLNAARRRVLNGLEDAVKESFERKAPPLKIGSTDRELIPHDTVFEVEDESVILPQITKGPYDELLRAEADRLADKVLAGTVSANTVLGDTASSDTASVNDSAVTVNSIAWVECFAQKGVRVIGGPGLNITNRAAAEALMELGMSNEFVKSPELLDKDRMGGVPLMISEHRFEPGTLKDRKGALYSVEYDETTQKSYIFAK